MRQELIEQAVEAWRDGLAVEVWGPLQSQYMTPQELNYAIGVMADSSYDEHEADEAESD